MIVTETVQVGDIEYRVTRSDEGFLIICDQSGQFFDIAYDRIDSDNTYRETNIPIPPAYVEPEEETTEESEG